MPVYYKNQVLRHNGTLLTEFLTLANIVSLDFELIEDNNIDIEELWGNCVGDSNQCRDDFMLKNRAKINELVRKYNELNREIKELKE